MMPRPKVRRRVTGDRLRPETLLELVGGFGSGFQQDRSLELPNDLVSRQELVVVVPGGVTPPGVVAGTKETGKRPRSSVEINELGDCPGKVRRKAKIAFLIAKIGGVSGKKVGPPTIRAV